MFSSGFKHQSVCSVGLVIFYTHFCCHLCHDSETKMQNTDFKWLTATTKVEGLHNDDVCMDTHNSQEDMATCHRDTLTWCQHIAETLFLKENNEVPEKSFSPLISCWLTVQVQRRLATGGQQYQTTRLLPSLTPEGNIGVYDATQSMTQSLTQINTKPRYQILMRWR